VTGCASDITACVLLPVLFPIFSRDTFHNILEHERQSAGAEYAPRSLEQKCFVGGRTTDLGFPSTYIPEMHVIEISSSIARFPKVARFLILHAMIHQNVACKTHPKETRLTGNRLIRKPTNL
jgi:hypothetical protein